MDKNGNPGQKSGFFLESEKKILDSILFWNEGERLSQIMQEILYGESGVLADWEADVPVGLIHNGNEDVRFPQEVSNTLFEFIQATGYEREPEYMPIYFPPLTLLHLHPGWFPEGSRWPFGMEQAIDGDGGSGVPADWEADVPVGLIHNGNEDVGFPQKVLM